jgi:hypothetical protein
MTSPSPLRISLGCDKTLLPFAHVTPYFMPLLGRNTMLPPFRIARMLPCGLGRDAMLHRSRICCSQTHGPVGTG